MTVQRDGIAWTFDRWISDGWEVRLRVGGVEAESWLGGGGCGSGEGGGDVVVLEGCSGGELGEAIGG